MNTSATFQPLPGSASGMPGSYSCAPVQDECPICCKEFSGRKVVPVLAACCPKKLCLGCATQMYGGKDISSRTCAFCRQNPMPLVLEGGAQFSKKSPFYEVPEERACRTGDRAKLEQCLQAKPKIARKKVYSSVSGCKEPLILVAVKYNQPESVKTLIRAGADLKAKDKDGITPIYLAAQRGQMEPLELLINAGAHINDNSNIWCLTPLHGAAIHDHPDCLNRLLSGGADVHARSRRGLTALHSATWNNSADCVRALLEAGADVNAKDKEGVSPLHIAARHGKRSILLSLAGYGARIDARSTDWHTPLHEAANKGHLDCLQSLIRLGAGVNVRSVDGGAPLHFAACHGHVDCIEALIASGADPDAQAKDGWTPLHEAVEAGQVKSLKALIATGADLKLRNKCGKTPGELAADQSKDDCVRLFEVAEHAAG